MIIERGPLNEIAERMRVFAEMNPYARAKPITTYRRRLPRGLELTLLLDDNGWYLEIARENVMPSTEEETVIRREFAVPGSAARAARQNPLRNGGGMRCAIRWVWSNAPNMPNESEEK